MTLELKNKYSEKDLKNIKDDIEKMDKHNQLKVLSILKEFDNNSHSFFNENRNGTFINLSELNNDVIQKLIQYSDYIRNQEQYLNILESQKNEYKKQMSL